ncbi:hypothetical protein ACFQX7_29460 [Luedemannella flava]|uniref:hypothetical protein n=1 Tax=Luedemannella flava TaxID=349316 RepID=UPI0031E1A37F
MFSTFFSSVEVATMTSAPRCDVKGRGEQLNRRSVHVSPLPGRSRLEQLLADGRIQRLERWSDTPELWWFELLPNPLGACNTYASTIAAELPEIAPA